MLKYILYIFVFLHYLPSMCRALTFSQLDSIFHEDICSVECDGRVHTICEKEQPEVKCNFNETEVYDITHIKSLAIRSTLVDGHNGLRDRIASRMYVGNMVVLAWDNTLEQMAKNYARLCMPFEDDACTHIGKSMQVGEVHAVYTTHKNSYLYIAQNRLCVESEFIPRDFIVQTLRGWYFEKNSMTPPKYMTDEHSHKTLGVLNFENNFTHMAFPLTNRFGCSIARYDKFFCIFCNYYPYYRISESNNMIFEHGEPVSICPTDFPLKSPDFSRLCTGDHEHLYDTPENLATKFYVNTLNFYVLTLLIQQIL